MSRIPRRLSWLAASALLAAACAESSPAAPEASEPAAGSTATRAAALERRVLEDFAGARGAAPELAHPDLEAMLVYRGSAALAPPPELPAPPARPRQRVDIDQLSEAIAQASGGRRWTTIAGGQEVEQLELLSATLGKPDWIEIVSEDLTASPLFMKFLDDAARAVCTQLITEESDEPLPEGVEERVFLVHAAPGLGVEALGADLDENLAHLLLRWHGREVGSDDPSLHPWRWLFTTVSHGTTGQTGDEALGAAAGWQAVCVALMTHPDFLSY